jgi:hypothetical protein
MAGFSKWKMDKELELYHFFLTQIWTPRGSGLRTVSGTLSFYYLCNDPHMSLLSHAFLPESKPRPHPQTPQHMDTQAITISLFLGVPRSWSGMDSFFQERELTWRPLTM